MVCLRLCKLIRTRSFADRCLGRQLYRTINQACKRISAFTNVITCFTYFSTTISQPDSSSSHRLTRLKQSRQFDDLAICLYFYTALLTNSQLLRKFRVNGGVVVPCNLRSRIWQFLQE